ncbi:MAG TPA: response regulator, partial [Coleofasciculaceae cyanobacterium]
FGAIASATLTALEANPEHVTEIAELALIDFQIGRQAVLAATIKGASSSQDTLEIGPCAALLALTKPIVAQASASLAQEAQESLSLIEDVFGSFPAKDEELLSVAEVEGLQDIQLIPEDQPLEEIFHLAPESLPELAETEVAAVTPAADTDETIDEFFGRSPDTVVDDTELALDAEIETNLVIDVEDVTEAPFVSETPVAESVGVEVVEEVAIAPTPVSITEVPETLEEAVQSIGEIFEELPLLDELPIPETQTTSLVPSPVNLDELQPAEPVAKPAAVNHKDAKSISTKHPKATVAPTPHLSVRVDSERLGRMNNLVGELAINRNGLSLQNDQLQRGVRELLNRFARVQNVVGNLQELSYQMLVNPERPNNETLPRSVGHLGELATRQADFDALELDRYGVLNSRLQGLLEDMVQLEESVDDIVLFARATNQTLEQQRQMLTQLRDELIWARMLPLGEVLNRYPRVLRDLSAKYHKPVNLNLLGTSVLVDKAVLEKLYDPLLHLLRNAFDHGIEPPQQRLQRGKLEQGRIEIRAYHQGSQTIIEVRDDGQGLNIDRIRERAVELGLLSASQVATVSNNRLYELIFEAGFSTASQVSELSGRGVGLDVVRAQMRSLKGTVSVFSEPGVGTTFTLRLPLTLTIAKLLVCFIGSSVLALPSDSVEEIVVPKTGQVKESGSQRFLQWRGYIVPAYRLTDLLEYNCPLPDTSPSKALIAVPSPQDWELPMLVIRQDQHILALEIDRLVTEQELVIKPFGSTMAPPGYTYGCTILGDGSLIPVIDAAALLEQLLGQHGGVSTVSSLPDTMKSLPINVTEAESFTTELTEASATPAALAHPTQTEGSSLDSPVVVKKAKAAIAVMKAPTVLVVDDAVALRRTLALTLERAGCQVLQARDGREAIEQLQQSPSVKLVVCDIEMPNMNGFEFLSYRRQDPQLSKIPVAMLTSRSNDKHRWLAMQLGAAAYFTKPYLEQEFVAAIKQIIEQGKSEPKPELQSV